MIPLIIALLSSVLAILAAWYQYQEKESERIEKDIQKKKADKFQSELISKTQSLDSANNEIKKLQQELIEKTTQLLNESKVVQKIQDDTIKYMVGDGIPTLLFDSNSDGPIHPVVVNRTNYPIYDVSIRVDDFDKILKCKTEIDGDKIAIDRSCVEQISKISPQFSLAINGGNTFGAYIIEPTKGIRHFRIDIRTRHRNFTYLCVLFYDTSLKYRIRVYEMQKDISLKLLEEHDHGLKELNETYWNEHFYANKKIYNEYIK